MTRIGVPDRVAALVRLAAPIALAQVGFTTMGMVDTAMVGRIDAASLAATALGHNYVSVVSLFGLGLMLGLDPIVTQRVGAGDPRGAGRALGHGCGLALVALPLLLGFAALLDGLFLRPNFVADPLLPRVVRADPAVAELASAYFWVRLPGIVPFLLFAAMRSWLYAQHRTRAVFVAMLAANLANVVLDYLLVFGDPGLERLGLPALGVPALGAVGAGIVTSICNGLMALMVLPMVLRGLRAASGPAGAGPGTGAVAGMAAIARHGFPIAGQLVMEMGVFMLVAAWMGEFGNEAVGGHQIALQVASFTFLVCVGLGSAATVQVGNAVGARDLAEARRCGLVAIGTSASWMALCGLTFWVLAVPLAALFTDDPSVRGAAATLLRIAAIFQVVDGVQATTLGALRGAGDTRVPFLLCLTCYWLVGLPVALLLAYSVGLAGPGLWYGLTVGLGCLGGTLFWRFLVVVRHLPARAGGGDDGTRAPG
ncbi:MAG: MATE family efflux transporter [Planctomycetes bacterium]|nr:MATE family efflux transporter [Planctomycetota bacterium]